jgi:hypothetical protein
MLAGNEEDNDGTSVEDATKQTKTAVFWCPKQGVYFSYKYRCGIPSPNVCARVRVCAAVGWKFDSLCQLLYRVFCLTMFFFMVISGTNFSVEILHRIFCPIFSVEILHRIFSPNFWAEIKFGIFSPKFWAEIQH